MTLPYSLREMRYKTLAVMLAFLLTIFIFSCASRHENSKMTVVSENRKQLNTLLSTNKGDSVLLLADDVLNGLLLADSLNEYATLNKILYDSLLPRRGYDSTKKYLLNIVRQENKLPKTDSLCQKILANAYFQYAVRLNGIQFSDTILSFFEKASLINSSFNALKPLQQVYIYKGLGIQYNIAGDMKKTLRNYDLEFRTYRAVAKEPINYNYLSGSTINLAISLGQINEHDSAVRIINNILLIQSIPLIKRGVLVLQKASSALQTGKIDSCKNSLMVAKKIINLCPCHSKNDTIDLNELRADLFVVEGKLALYEKRFTQSVAAFRKALWLKSVESASVNRYVGKILIGLGETFLLQKQPDSAIIYFQQALSKVIPIVNATDIYSMPNLAQLYAENTIIEALDAKASAFQMLYLQNPNIKYLQTAVQCYTLSFEVERKLLQYFSYDESKLLMLTESRQRSQKAITICYRLQQLTKNKEWAEKAFQFAEKNKAFVLLESVKRNLAGNKVLQEDTLYQKTQALQLQLAYNEKAMSELTADSLKSKLIAEKTRLDNDLLFAKTALARQSEAYQLLMEQEDSITTVMVTDELLNEHTGFIEFFSTDSVSYAFVLNKNKPLQFIQYNTTLSGDIDSVLHYFSSPTVITNDPIGYQNTAYHLYNELQLNKLDKACTNLMIIPDGKLSFVPFDALVTIDRPTVNLKQAGWFINQSNTLYGYSAAILLKQKNNNTIDDNSITVFAPVFNNGENKQQPLVYAQAEAEAIEQQAHAKLYMKAAATLNNFKEQFMKPGILHIATHAYADTGTNNIPRIAFIDSSLLLSELYALHTNASLIVLSACETGIGQLNKSEGPLSLARGFYYAGAKNVITSYWSVDDKSTASLFNLFYKNISTTSSSDALYNAKKDFIENTSGSFASPYYWAGFVHFGIPQKPAGHHYWWWLLILPATALFYYLIKKK